MEYKGIKLSKYEIKPYYFIVAKADFDKISPEQARTIYDNIKQEFPEHEVILVPDGITLDFVEWKRLLDFVMSIKPEGEDIDGR
jgi:hypothetical protein